MSPASQAGPISPSGLLLVDKPYRLSSMSICRVVKRRLMNAGFPKSIKVGHGGTLDPLASGLMVILIGKATKLCDTIMAGRKRYVADIDLANLSSTDDLEGEIKAVEVSPPSPPTREQIEAVIRAKFTGTIMQRPPAHSAIWIDGERAYDLARAGKAPVMQQRPVEVHSIDILEYRWPRLRVGVSCGKGTYIRSLARDLGRELGVGGMLSGLRRTEVAPYSIEQAIALDDVPDPLREEHLLKP